MGFGLADRVREQVTSFSGTGAVTLPVSAVTGGYKTFLAGWGASGTGLYLLKSGSQWEVGLGTLNAGGTNLSRTTIYDGSSGVGTAVNFSVGSLDCSGVMPAYHLRSLPSIGGNATLINGSISAAAAANTMVITILNNNGQAPSKTDPVFIVFRHSNIGVGNFSVLAVTTALSFTISSGSTMGATSAVPFRVWLGALDNAGTVELFAINCVNGTTKDIYPLGKFPIITTTAEGGSGGADSAHVPYSVIARTDVPFAILGYFSWEAGLATAGTWNVNPKMQLFGHGVPLPGHIVQSVEATDAAVATTTATIPVDDTIPQSGEGAQFMSKAITPSSTANVLHIESDILGAVSAVFKLVVMALFQDSTANAISSMMGAPGNVDFPVQVGIKHRMVAGTVAATTFKIRAGCNAAGTLTFNGIAGVRALGGTLFSRLGITELQG